MICNTKGGAANNKQQQNLCKSRASLGGDAAPRTAAVRSADASSRSSSGEAPACRAERGGALNERVRPHKARERERGFERETWAFWARAHQNEKTWTASEYVSSSWRERERERESWGMQMKKEPRARARGVSLSLSHTQGPLTTLSEKESAGGKSRTARSAAQTSRCPARAAASRGVRPVGSILACEGGAGCTRAGPVRLPAGAC